MLPVMYWSQDLPGECVPSCHCACVAVHTKDIREGRRPELRPFLDRSCKKNADYSFGSMFISVEDCAKVRSKVFIQLQHTQYIVSIKQTKLVLHHTPDNANFLFMYSCCVYPPECYQWYFNKDQGVHLHMQKLSSTCAIKHIGVIIMRWYFVTM